jgi:hypothetical protein
MGGEGEDNKYGRCEREREGEGVRERERQL